MTDGMTKFGRLLVRTKIVSGYKLKGSNKIGGFILNWWNPAAWILGPLFFVLISVIEGIPYAWKYRHENGFGMNPWYNDKELEWF